jgi:hypothetical protein
MSAGRPRHRAPAKDVRVRVRDGLPAVRAGVEDDPIAGILDALGLGDGAGGTIVAGICPAAIPQNKQSGTSTIIVARW